MLYGQGMPAFLRELRNQSRRFTSPPIGPLGMHIKVKEEYKQYALPIEAMIGKTNNYVELLGGDG